MIGIGEEVGPASFCGGIYHGEVKLPVFFLSTVEPVALLRTELLAWVNGE